MYSSSNIRKLSPKAIGTQFESLFEKICRMNRIGVLRIHDGFKRIGGGFIPVRNSCDWVLFYEGKTALVDTKTQEKGQTFAAGHVDAEQINKMHPFALDHNVTCGYVVYFRNEGCVIFLPTATILEDRRNIDDGIYLGKIEDCKVKRIFDGPTLCSL